MLYGKYQFNCRLESDAFMPPYKGSTFRGVFGTALKRVVCALKRQECETCLLREKCLYTLAFETRLAMQVPKGARFALPPHPFVIEPPLTEQTRFENGSTFDCSLILFGDMNRSLPYFVYAFDQMGKIGIGKRINGKRGRFLLESAACNGRKIYSHEKQELDQSKTAEDLNLIEDQPTQKPERHMIRRRPKIKLGGGTPKVETDTTHKIKVEFKTPLRLKFENRLKAELPFHILVRAMLRRSSSLFEVYGSGEPDLDYKGMIERAKNVTIAENRLSWFDWQRYSNRQETKMFMGGMVGSVTYEGKLEDYLPLLEFSEKTHLGKNTSFGLGKIMLKII